MQRTTETFTPRMISTPYPLTAGSSSGLSLRGLIEEIVNSPFLSTIERHSLEERFQQHLNEGQKPSEDDLAILQKAGYSISHNPATIEQLRNFSLSNHPELSQALREANEETGLLVNKYTMFQPGPASAKSVNGVAKGFEEISLIYQNQSEWRETVSETIAHYIQSLIKQMPLEKRWRGLINLLYLNGSTDSLLSNLGIDLQQILPEHGWNMLNINIKPNSRPPFLEESSPHHPIPSGSQIPIQEQFYPPSPRLQDKAQVIIITDFALERDQIPLFIARLNQWRAENALVIFIEDAHESDEHDIVFRHQRFMRARSVGLTKGEALEDAMKQSGYQVKEVIEESLLDFPVITPEIREEILGIKEGDYENPYTNTSEDFKTVKALMEYVAGFPLEAMTREDRWHYLEALENKFNFYEGSFLKHTHRIFFACPENSEPFFKHSFTSMLEQGLSPSLIYKRAEELTESFYYKAAELSLVQAIQKSYHEWEFLRANKNLHRGLLVCQELIEGIDRLGEVKINQEMYPEAAALFCYAKRVELKYGQKHPSTLQHLEMQIERVERALLSDGKDVEVIIGGTEQAESSQAKLNAIRDLNKATLETMKKQNLPSAEMASALQTLHQEMSMQMKNFLRELINDAIELLEQVKGLPPCEFAFIALRSLNEEMTPYPKIEFSIVVQNEEHNDYFLALATLLHVLIIKIGESPISEFNIKGLSWLSDNVTPQGFRFGLQSNTTAQRSLIHTATNLARLQRQEKNELWTLERIHLPTLLSNVSYVTGSLGGETLFAEYENLVGEILTPEVRQQRALMLMEDDLQTFIFDFEQANIGKVDQIYDDLFRFMNTMLDGLAGYYNLQSPTNCSRVEELYERGVLTQGGAQDLKELLMLSQELRLSLCFSNGQQQAKAKDIKANKAVISSLYYRLIPFWQAMTKFFELTHNDENPIEALQQERFYNDSFYIQGVIAQRLNHPRKARKALEKETAKTPESLELIGDAEFILAHYVEALKHFREALTFHDDRPLLQARLLTKIGNTLKKMAKIQDDGNSAPAAYSQAETMLRNALEQKQAQLFALKRQLPLQADGSSSPHSSSSSSAEPMPEKRLLRDIKALEKEITVHQKLLESTYRLQSLLQLSREDFSKAKEGLDFAKNLTKKRTRTKPEDPHSQLIADLSAVENAQLEARIAYEENRDYSHAQASSEEAKKILISIYRRHDHPKVLVHEAMTMLYHPIPPLDKQIKLIKQLQKAFGYSHPCVISAYGRLSSIYSLLNLKTKAVSTLTQQSSLAEHYYGSVHPIAADAQYNLGNILTPHQAEEHHLKALEIRRSIFGEFHPDVAMSYNNLGFAEADLGKAQEALAHQELALKIFREIYGNTHTTIGSILSNISATLKQLEHYEESLKYEQQIIEWQTAKYGENHSNAIRHHNNLANALTNVGYHNEAVVILEKVLGSNANLIQDHPMLPTIYNNLESALSRLGKFNEALSCFEKEVALRREKYGEEDPKVKNSGKERALLNGIISSIKNLSRKRYDRVFTTLDSIIRSHGAYTPDCICFLLYTSILSNKNKQMEWHMARIISLQKDPKIPLIERGKIALAMIQFYLKQKNFNEAIKYAFILKKIEPGMLLTYRLIEAVGLEQPAIKGKQVPFRDLGEFYYNKAFQAGLASKKQTASGVPSPSSSSSSNQRGPQKKLTKKR